MLVVYGIYFHQYSIFDFDREVWNEKNGSPLLRKYSLLQEEEVQLIAYYFT